MCLAEILGILGFFAFPALLPTFIEQWHLTNTEAGWINAVFFLGYMLAVPVLVSLTDRVDPRRIYLISMALTALAIVGFPLLVGGLWTALALRALAGVGMAGTYMPGLKALSDLIEGPVQSRAIAFYTSSFGIGSSLSFYLSGKIAAWQDWQTAFLLLSLGPVLALVWVWRVLPAKRPVPPARPSARWQDFTTVLRNRRAMGYTLAYAVHNFELFGLRSWIVVFLTFNSQFQSPGGVTIAPTTFAALVTLLSLPSSVTGNELAVRFGRRRVVCAIMTVSALLAVVLGFTASLPFAVVATLCIIYGVAVMADSSPITAGTVAEATPGLRGTTMAVHACVGFLGSFLGPLAFGVVLDLAGGREQVMSWGLAFATMGAAVALGPVFVLMLNPGRQSPAD
ncbi:MAG: MFS transporter [SAR324 cluster bacterium]|nr:MFS transporter [SAR324 cluster bacterium]